MSETDNREPDGNGEFERVWEIAQATALPGLELSITHGKPSIKVKGKFIGWVKETSILAIHCPQEWKPHLIETRPDIYFETDHYKGWPAIQMHLDTASDADIDEALRRAWMAQAPARLRKEHGGR